jgi:hypothetical protein
MRDRIDRLKAFGGKIMTVLVLFAIVRLAFGVVAILFLSDDSLAYSMRATLILALTAVVAFIVALFVRRRLAPSP